MTLQDLADKVNAAIAAGVHKTAKVYVWDGPYETTKPVHEAKVTTVEAARRHAEYASSRYIHGEKHPGDAVFLLDIFY